MGFVRYVKPDVFQSNEPVQFRFQLRQKTVEEGCIFPANGGSMPAKPLFQALAGMHQNIRRCNCSPLREQVGNFYLGNSVLPAQADPTLQPGKVKGIDASIPENIHQLKFTQTLPREAFDFIGKYKEIVCPICGKINYAFAEPMLDNIRIRKDMIPEGIDAFISEMNTGEGRGFKLLIASKKLYQLLTEEMQEKHFHFAPIG